MSLGEVELLQGFEIYTKTFKLFNVDFVYVYYNGDHEIKILQHFFDILNSKNHSVDSAIEICDRKFHPENNNSIYIHCLMRFLRKDNNFEEINSLVNSTLRDDKLIDLLL